MFIIFDGRDGETEIVNDRYVNYIGRDNDGDFVVETDGTSYIISEEQFIKIVDIISSNSLDCRIPRKFKEI